MEQSPFFIPPQAIQELQILYEAEFGQPLSLEKAQEMAVRLLRLFRVLLG